MELLAAVGLGMLVALYVVVSLLRNIDQNLAGINAMMQRELERAAQQRRLRAQSDFDPADTLYDTLRRMELTR